MESKSDLGVSIEGASRAGEIDSKGSAEAHAIDRKLLLRDATLQILLIVISYLVYDSTKNLLHHDGGVEAFKNADVIIRIERSLHIFHEISLQQWFLSHARAVVRASDWLYSAGFWAAVWVAAIGLYVTGKERYKFYRGIMLISFFFAILIFALYPLAPPRLVAGVGAIDTVSELGPKLYFSSGDLIGYNEYAAMPSMHFAWSLIIVVACFEFRSLWVKAAGIIFICAMSITIVITANHYILDIVAAVPVAIVSLAAGYRLKRIKSPTHR